MGRWDTSDAWWYSGTGKLRTRYRDTADEAGGQVLAQGAQLAPHSHRWQMTRGLPCGLLRGNQDWQGRQDSNPRPAVLETWRSVRCAPRLRNPCAVREDRRCLDSRFLQRRCSSRHRRDRRLHALIASTAGARTGEDYIISAPSASLAPELPFRPLAGGRYTSRSSASAISTCLGMPIWRYMAMASVSSRNALSRSPGASRSMSTAPYWARV